MQLSFLLIGLTVLCTLLSWKYPVIQGQGMMFPYKVWHHKAYHSIITSGFLHANVSHLLMNMVTLFIFGPTLELIMGPLKFLTLYLVCLCLSVLPTLFRYRHHPAYATLGASGAVTGVLFSYILYMPLSVMFILYVPIGLPALVFGGVYMLYTLWESRKKHTTINHEAHFAGALSGLIVTLMLDPESILIFLTSIGVPLPSTWFPV